MSKIILYSTGCPKCNVLTTKLKQKNIIYTEVNDIDVMKDLGIMSVPMLQIDDNPLMDFRQANEWINGYTTDDDDCDSCKL